MSELGERLRQARESQGIPLAQAAVDTRILQQSLVALEEGAFHRLPGDVVVRGFIRNYAQYLGLPTEELIEIYRRERGASEKIRVIPATNPPPRQSYVLPSFFGVFFVTIVLVGLAYVALNALGRIGDGDQVAAGVVLVSTPAPSTPTRLPSSTPAPTVAGVPTMGAVATQPTTTPTAEVAQGNTTPQPSTTPAAPIVVEVSIPSNEEASWLRVFTDGVKVYERIMQPGEREVFQANRDFYIRAGNPPVVQVSVNGLQQGSLGVVRGKPVDWYWPPQ